MSTSDAIEIQALKADSFGRIALMRGHEGVFVRRDLRHVPRWLWLPAWWLARRLLQALHRRGVAHNDLAKEANWLVLADGRPALIDFQLAVRGNPRSRWMRLLAREDLRHLLKHKRTYCPQALTPTERRLLGRHSWVRNAWFATGKPVYRFITRKVLHWEDNEGQGPKP